MKRIILILLLFSNYLTAQTWQPTSIRQRFVNGIGIPTRDTVSGTLADSSQLVLRPQDSVIYFKYKGSWRKVGSASVTSIPWDSVSGKPLNFQTTYAMSNDVKDSIQARLRITDTTNKWVNNITRISGKDSIIYYIGSTRYAIKDSVGQLQNGRFGNDTATIVMAKVHNDAGSILNNGEVVYLSSSGTNSEAPSVKRANNKADATSANTFGFVTGSIPNNDTGYIIISGKIESINTSSFANGDIIYLDSISGQYTKNKPKAPYHLVYLGVIVKSNAGNGAIFVKTQNGYELDELHDVLITSPARNNSILLYDSTAKLWKDTLASVITDNKLSISDTASMLSPYKTFYPRNAISLTTTGTSGEATYNNSTGIINIPQYTFSGITGSGTANQLTYWNGTGSVTGSTRLTFNPTPTASGAIGRSLYLTPTVTASANNDVLVGLDIASTFTTSGFSGANTADLRLGQKMMYTNSNWFIGDQYNNSYIQHNAGLRIVSTAVGSHIQLKGIGGTTYMQMFNNTGNLLLQNGGTFTDAGYRLDVNGTARITNSITASSLIKSGGTSSQYLMADGSVSTLTNPITGTGNTNYIPKWTGTSTLGNSTIYDNNNEVTIGGITSMSGAKLSVVANSANVAMSLRNKSAAGYSGIHFYNSDSSLVGHFGWGNTAAYNLQNNLYFGSLINAPLVLTTNDIERMRITGTGNVGIGTTSPFAKLHVLGSSRMTSTGGIATPLLSLLQDNNANGYYFSIDNALDGRMELRNDAGTTIQTWQRSSGNVGIGTTNPVQKLDVIGSVNSTEYRLNNVPALLHTNVYTALRDPANSNILLLGDTNDPTNYYSNSQHIFRNRGGSSEYMRITSGGNTIIKPGADDGANALQVNGSAKITSLAGTGERNVSVDATGKLIVSTTAATVASGTYNPTASFATNATSIGIYTSPYTQIGNVVSMTVSGYFTPTSANTYTKFNLTIPVPAISVGSAILYGTTNISNGGATVNLAGRVTQTTGATVGFVVESYPTFSGAVAYFTANIQYTLQ